MLDDNLAWTTDLGQAFLNQPADVMDSVQRLRAPARAMGNLLSTPQQTVVVDDGIIAIVPAAP
jgi:predicted PP-loop superfamily ATPase